MKRLLFAVVCVAVASGCYPIDAQSGTCGPGDRAVPDVQAGVGSLCVDAQIFP